MELGICLIMSLPDRSKNLKCFKEPIELDNTSKDEPFKLSIRKYLNLKMHASTKDMGCSVWKIIV